jgi:hypothetical protein
MRLAANRCRRAFRTRLIAKPDVDEVARLQHLLGRLGEAALVTIEWRQGEKAGKPGHDADQ